MHLYGGAGGVHVALVPPAAPGSPAQSGCGQPAARLAFVTGTPFLVHLACGPPAEVFTWNCRTCARMSTTLWPASDAVAAILSLPLPQWPVLLVGSADGDGAIAAAAVTAGVGLEMRDYRLRLGFTEHESGGADADVGHVVSLSLAPRGGDRLLLLGVTAYGAVCLHDVTTRAVVARTAAGDA